jgi:predicted RNA binding protein with dsRBD fold (UPF0201 family)
MKLQDIFNTAMIITSEVLSTEQETSVKSAVDIVFFSEVVIKFKLDTSILSYEEALSNLQDIHGDLEVIENIVSDLDTVVFVRPLDLIKFDLPLNYQGEYLSLCEFMILNTSLKNTNTLKGLGIDELSQQQTIDISTIKQNLKNKFNIGIGSTLT